MTLPFTSLVSACLSYHAPYLHHPTPGPTCRGISGRLRYTTHTSDLYHIHTHTHTPHTFMFCFAGGMDIVSPHTAHICAPSNAHWLHLPRPLHLSSPPAHMNFPGGSVETRNFTWACTNGWAKAPRQLVCQLGPPGEASHQTILRGSGRVHHLASALQRRHLVTSPMSVSSVARRALALCYNSARMKRYVWRGVFVHTSALSTARDGRHSRSSLDNPSPSHPPPATRLTYSAIRWCL